MQLLTRTFVVLATALILLSSFMGSAVGRGCLEEIGHHLFEASVQDGSEQSPLFIANGLPKVNAWVGTLNCHDHTLLGISHSANRVLQPTLEPGNQSSHSILTASSSGETNERQSLMRHSLRTALFSSALADRKTVVFLI